MSKVFIAGVSQRSDCDAILAESKRICEIYGMELVNDGVGYWDILFAIRSADVIIANLNPNHGILVDGETEAEIGASAMIGKKIYGYYSNADLTPISKMILTPVTLIEGSFEDCIRAL